MNEDLGLEIGDEIECSCFIPGYRGAWFRGKIKSFDVWEGEACCRVKYIDFDDDVLYPHKIYDCVPGKPEKQLMIRPAYPNLLHNAGDSSEFAGVVNRDYNVDDYVDWDSKGCFWECQVLRVLDTSTVELLVPDPPYGESGVYTVSTDLLRPALSWSPRSGWRIKAPKAPPLVTLLFNDGRGSTPSSTCLQASPIKKRRRVIQISEDDAGEEEDAGEGESSSTDEFTATSNSKPAKKPAKKRRKKSTLNLKKSRSLRQRLGLTGWQRLKLLKWAKETSIARNAGYFAIHFSKAKLRMKKRMKKSVYLDADSKSQSNKADAEANFNRSQLRTQVSDGLEKRCFSVGSYSGNEESLQEMEEADEEENNEAMLESLANIEDMLQIAMFSKHVCSCGVRQTLRMSKEAKWKVNIKVPA